MYLDRVARPIVNEEELPVCGTSPDTVVTSRHKPCDTANTNFRILETTYFIMDFLQNGITHENSCLGSSAPLRPYSSIMFSVGDAC